MDRSSEVQSHVLLQKQMQDIIESQFKEIEVLKAQLKKKDNMVLYEHFEDTVKELQEEKEAHNQTKSELRETQGQLDFAQGEIEVLTKQLEREKAQFNKTFGALKTKALKETVKNVELENKCNVIKQEAEQKSDILDSRELALVDLNHRLQETEESYRRKLTDLNIQMQQDMYISQVLEGKQKEKTTRPGSKTTVSRGPGGRVKRKQTGKGGT